jgi:putative nucleotidyltransferase with HDIG domain
MDGEVKGRRRPLRLALFAMLLLLVMAAVAYLSLIMPLTLRGPLLPLELGQVAPQDLRAPARGEYVSEVLTEEARVQAERAAAPVYSPIEASIAREQIASLRDSLDAISEIRADPSTSAAEREAAIVAVEGLQLTPASAAGIARLSDARWSLIQQEALRVLEAAMRQPIHDDTVESARSELASMVTLSLSGDQAQLVAELVSPFVIPNEFYSPELTEQARQEARDAVEPVTRTFLSGQIVVQRGTVIGEAEMEALTRLGLVQEQASWEDYVGALALVAVLTAFVGLYLWRRRPNFARDPRGMLLVGIVFAIFLIGARLTIPERAIVPYLYPLPAFALILTALFGPEAALVFAIPLSFLVPYGVPTSEDLTLFFLLTSLCGSLALFPSRRVGHFLRAGVVIALAGMAVLVAYRLPFTSWDWTGLATLAGACLINGMVSAGLALLVEFFAASLLGFTTPLHLLDVARPDHPLLAYILRVAPGTYQHSLMVANLAEQAADAIGADSLLVRVGALYHDCGKTANPQFFIENQPPDRLDPHDDMEPEEAARQVIQHVADGVALARKYRLPRRVRDFITEHHGTLITRYQYARAVQAADGDQSKVDIERFRYPGPAPRSRETAILMLCDMTEARTRSERPKDEDALRTSIQRSVEICQQNGQLDDTQLTLRDLHRIGESLAAGLQGSYHPRVAYPSVEAPLLLPETPK